MGNSPSQSEDPDSPRHLGDENDLPLSANSKPATWGFAPAHLRPPKAMMHEGKRKRRTPLSRPQTVALKRSATRPYHNNKRMRRQSPGEAIPRHILVSGGGTKNSPISLLDSDVEDDGTKESSLPSAAVEKRNKRPKNPASTGRGSVLSQRQEQQQEETDLPRRHAYDGGYEKDDQREEDRTTAVEAGKEQEEDVEPVAPPFLSRERDGLSSPPVDSVEKRKEKSPAPEKDKHHDDDDEDSLMNLSRDKVNETSQKEKADAIAATREENSTEAPARDVQESADEDEDAAPKKQGRKDDVNDFPPTDGDSDGEKSSSESSKNAPRLRENGMSQRAKDSTSSVDAGPNDAASIQQRRQERNSGKTGGQITGSVASKSPASVDLRLSPSSKRTPSSAARLGIVGNRRRMKKHQVSGSPGMEGHPSQMSAPNLSSSNSIGNGDSGDVFDFDREHPPSPKQSKQPQRESQGELLSAAAPARHPVAFRPAQASAHAPDSRETREQSNVHRELQKQSSTVRKDSASLSLKRNQIGVNLATANLDGFEKSSERKSSDASAFLEKRTETTESRNQSDPRMNANTNPNNQTKKSHNTEAEDEAPGRSRRKRRRRRRNDQGGDSPPMKVPPSLLPFNRPGKQSVPMVTNSRLRNRDEKNDKKADVPYLKYPSLRRCEEILGKPGEPFLAGHGGNRNLQDEEESSGVESTTAKDPYLNHPKRCVVVTVSNKQRCGQIVKSEKCCFCHNSHEKNCSTNSLNVSFDAARRRGLRCVAVAKDGKQCTFETIGRQIVFCPMHIKDPPGECFSIPDDFQTDIEDHEENEAGNEERSEKMTDSKVSGDDKEPSEEDDEVESEEKEDTDVQSAHGKAGQGLAYLAPNNGLVASDFSFSNTGGDQEEQMEESRPQAQSDETISSMGVSIPEDRIADGLENRCVFVNIHERCRNESLPGGILCKFHWMRKEKNKLSLFDTGPMEEDHSELSGQSDSEVESSKTDDESESSGEDALDAPEVNGGCDDESESTASTMTSEPTICPQTGMYTHRAFTRLWKKAEDIIGQRTEDIEQTALVRGANRKVDSRDTTHQTEAQYGRILPKAMKRLMTIMNLEKDDIFVDIGHGIGNTCLHASYCIGCESRGIEVVSDRHSIADVFRGQLETLRNETDVSPPVGKIDLRLGKLEDPENTDFLTRGVTKAYVNNFNGVFSNRLTMKGTSDGLDGYIAGLFGLMKPGSVMVTLYPLSLYTDLDDTNKRREKNGLSQSKNASFFKREDVELGPAGDCVQWVQPSGNKEKIIVHKYTRLEQPNGEDAVFLCVNPNCENAVNDVPIRASVPNEEGRFVMNRCNLCNHNPKPLRSRRSRDGTEILPNYRV